MFVSYFLAHLIRYENYSFLVDLKSFIVSALIVVGFRTLIFVFSSIYKSLWAYASIHDLLEIIKTTLLSSLVSTTALLFYNRFSQQSRMVPILDTLILLSILCFRSFSWRIFRDQYLNQKTKVGKPTILIGAGKLGAMLLSEIRRQPELNLNPVGFLDDDNNKIGAYIYGIPVIGKIDDLIRILHLYSIQETIITMSNVSGKVISDILKVCGENHVNVRILPSITEIFYGKNFNLNQLREIRVEDLLGREAVDLEIESIRLYLQNKDILITGAGGSIGSEIARQVSMFNPNSVVLLDNAETPLYEIDYELGKKHPNIKFKTVIADVKNLSRLNSIFEKYHPMVVFHCAAYKHVPLMEINPSEAVINNVMGTKNICDVSRLFGIEKFVMISTDKAVRPVNIMGASKRAAELYIQYIAPTSKTEFVTVRFGNVLGSNGSVIPRFREQIEKGGPVTVTHPDIIRYFMTIPEASQLVLQAGSMGERGEIFILDMGEPVKILDMAEEMIRLSGYQPYRDIDIVFTGLRPGEKLYEELLLDLEGIKETHHPKIRIATHIENPDRLTFINKLNLLFSYAKQNKDKELYDLFKDIIPEYQKHQDYYMTISK